MKLYLVVQAALSNGMKCAQACHALHAFTRAFPEETARWEADSNIVVLEDPRPDAWATALEARGLRVARFQEPDLDNAVTAICAEPAARRALRDLPLSA